MPRRVLVSTFGSAGDVFPLVPVIQTLQSRGDEVRVAVHRGIGLYLRALGLPTIGLGDGSELLVVDDVAAISARFDGWSSWRHTAVRYVRPNLDDDVRAVTRVCARWPPDVVLCSGFAAAARVVALRDGIPLIEASIYPQHRALRGGGRNFAGTYRRSVAMHLPGRDAATVTQACWGVPPAVYMHDRVLLGGADPDVEIVGYPRWDHLPATADDLESAMEFLTEPAAVVTFGSFLGLTQREAWTEVTRALTAARHRVLLIGAPRPWIESTVARRDDIRAVGFVPLSQVMPRASIAVHHGGLGTTFTTLAAGAPALVVPLAYDQSCNARLVEAAGVGRKSSVTSIGADIAATDLPALRATASEAAARLVHPKVAASRVVDALDVAGSSR